MSSTTPTTTPPTTPPSEKPKTETTNPPTASNATEPPQGSAAPNTDAESAAETPKYLTFEELSALSPEEYEREYKRIFPPANGPRPVIDMADIEVMFNPTDDEESDTEEK